MQFMKSLLLGSAAGLVVVASAQAADLPTRKGAPAAEYVRVCSITVNGTPIVGFTLPGSDTCLKISGYNSAQYTYGPARNYTQNAVGLFDRAQVNFDAVSNTAYGPLLAHLELQMDYGIGFDSRYGVTTSSYSGNARSQVNNGYIQWAGLTAGKHGSYFDFLAGGAAWDDIISPDHTGTPIPLIAYTASFGGGFSATISAESPEGSPTNASGNRAPDIVGQLAVSQAWGGAQLSAVYHDARGATVTGVGFGTTNTDVAGFAVLGGLKFNIPGYAGADIKLQGVYEHDAEAYSGFNGIGDYNYGNYLTAAGTPVLQVGEAGIPGGLAFNDYTVSTTGAVVGHSDGWSVAGIADFPISTTFKISPEASYGELRNGGGNGSLNAFVGGGVLEWTPVKNLVFDLDLLYVNGNFKEPYLAGGTNPRQDFDGFNAKLRIERDF